MGGGSISVDTPNLRVVYGEKVSDCPWSFPGRCGVKSVGSIVVWRRTRLAAGSYVGTAE